MNVVVKPVTSKRERNDFIRFPYRLYQGNTYWVPPLLISQHEALDTNNNFWKINSHQFYLAYSDNQIVGRIAAFVNADHAAHFGIGDGFFGFLEAFDNTVIFSKLFEHAEAFLKRAGCRRMIGPMNPTIHHELGVLTLGFESSPYFMLTYNKPCYNKHISDAGFAKLKDFAAYELNPDNFNLSKKIVRTKELLEKKHSVSLRTPRMNDFMEELNVFHEIYNNAFVNHWGFAPISWEDFRFLGKDMKAVLDKEMVLIAEIKGVPVGFILAIPNLNEVLRKIPDGRLFPFGLFRLLFYKSKIKSLRVITIAVKKEYQHLGIGSVLYPELASRAKARGYTRAELSWVVEDNVPMNKMCREVGGQISKNYRLYSKPLE